jgi:exopolyphosphatase/guanosine-5'-triphosphate,3'-diphosphate pyrophosphatase
LSSQPLGLIDIGSNSIVLVVARPDNFGWKVLERRKKTARLGAQIEPDGKLSASGIKELEETLTEFCALARVFDARLRIAATASLRNVSNGSQVALTLSVKLGHEIRILSERDEANFAFRGVWAAEGRDATPLLVVDVGGGSSEVAWGTEGRIEGFFSLPLGAVRLASLQNGADPVQSEHYAAMAHTIDDHLHEVIAKVPSNAVAFACSGSIRRLCRLGRGRAAVLSCAELDDLVEALKQRPLRGERLAMKGMDPERVDALLPAALIHQALAKRFGWQAYQLSDGGLRRGLLDAE